jgi:hypothetical protein
MDIGPLLELTQVIVPDLVRHAIGLQRATITFRPGIMAVLRVGK